MEVFGIIGTVGDDVAWGHAAAEFGCPHHLALLARTCNQTHGIAQRIGCSMDLGAQAPTAAAKALGMRPPFARRAPPAWAWARTTVAST